MCPRTAPERPQSDEQTHPLHVLGLEFSTRQTHCNTQTLALFYRTVYSEGMTSTKRTRTRKIIDRPAVAVLYTRVSTSAQVDSGLSLDGQEADLQAAAAAAGYATVVISDEGKSAGRGKKRPGLERALQMLADGEAAALYVSKIDRLARSTIDALTIAEQAERQGWRLVSLDLGLDTSSPVGRLVLSVLSAAAEMERERIAERHRDWHRVKRSQGVRWGVDEGPKGEISAEIRQRIATDHSNGRSLRAIAASLNADQIPTARGGKWHASTVQKILNSPTTLTLVA